MSKWYCSKCGHMYNEAVGDEKRGIPPNTLFKDLDPGWVCPRCGSSKDKFTEVAG